MTVRIFAHATTGRSIRVREGSRAERLVVADENWSEVQPEKAPAPRPKKSKTDDE